MKRKNHLLIAITFLLLVSGFSTFDSGDFLENIKENLRRYNSNFPEEKVYVQLDKPFYKPGEDIWFNVFVLNSNTHQATHVSDVVYVELIDPKGNIAYRMELVVHEGAAHGDFQLQSSTSGGIYQLRAYTQWMRNFGIENFFKKEIQVQRIITPRLLLKLNYEKESYGQGDQVNATLEIENLKNQKITNAIIDYRVNLGGIQILSSSTQSNTQGTATLSFTLPDTLNTHDGLLVVVVKAQGVEESISRSVPIVLNKITLQFFPEGGHWMENVSSTMAFKALNEFGKGTDISGSIVDENNNIVTRFESFHMGMGAFKIIPQSGEKYYARIECPAGSSSLVMLPSITSPNFVLNLERNEDNTIHWSIFSKETSIAYFVGKSHGDLFYTEEIKLKKGHNSVKISTKKFPAGITVFTLFNHEGIEQCERLLFLNNEKGLNIRLKPDKKQYQPREKVQVEIETTNTEGKPIPAKISLAVIDDQLISFADDKQDNILSSMLLSSEVKGEIQEPSFYFDPTEPKAAQALDYLLMTQGWRRFSWKDVTENNPVITHTPEKVKNLGGILLDNQGTGFSSEVTLLELGGKRRIVKVQTTKEGYFVFKNIDPTISILLLAKKEGQIVIKKENNFSISLNDKEGTIILPEVSADVVNLTSAIQQAIERNNSSESGLNMSLDEDASQLEEVIVVGYGVTNKRSLSGSITTITENSVENIFSTTSIENAMQGRVAGVVVTPYTGNPGAQANITIRGLSSLAAGRNDPLYVIDGHPMGTSLNQNFSNGSMVGPDDIESIEIINSPEATALYGSAAANGVIAITTRSRLRYHNFQAKRKPSKYSSLTVSPRNFSATREFYVPPPINNKNEKRADFQTTVYWNHTIVTNEKGEAKFSFYNNDAVSAFRITAEGFSGSGLIGKREEVYYTELPLSLDVKLPEFLGFEDVLKLPVRIKNETTSVLSGKLTLNLPPELLAQESPERELTIQPKSTETLWFTITPQGIEGEFPISIKLESKSHNDELNHIIRVHPIGFPVRLSFSSKDLDKSIQFSIQDAEKNTLKAELTAFPDLLSDLFTGAESILREPHGCFEQVSSSTFPNILALQFLKQSGLLNPTIEKQALSYIRNGYKKLTAYEIKGGGFEWFGAPPAHEGLTAYGLLQFYEMQKVFSDVDDQMMRRTTDWLLSNRNGKGGYKQHAGKYGFSGASEDVTNTYITYALSETGTKDILLEYTRAFSEAIKSKDMYRMALVATTAHNLEKKDDYNRLVNDFKTIINSVGFNNLKADHSIVRSYGNSLQVETIALWTIALMKSTTPDLFYIDNCIQHILASRAYGQFGSTQATTLALKALTEYANLVRVIRTDGEIQVFIDNTLADKLQYKKDVREKLTLNNFTKNISNNGEQTLRVLFNGTPEPLPYSVNLQWYTKIPQSNNQCRVSLSTSLNAKAVRINETVRLTATLINKDEAGLPMTVAVIGIPAGLSAQPWQLKELQEKEVFDFYEVTEGNLILYYREIGPKARHIINLDLKAEIPGSYLGSASSAYVYYTNEYKHWTAGNSIKIE